MTLDEYLEALENLKKETFKVPAMDVWDAIVERTTRGAYIQGAIESVKAEKKRHKNRGE